MHSFSDSHKGQPGHTHLYVCVCVWSFTSCTVGEVVPGFISRAAFTSNTWPIRRRDRSPGRGAAGHLQHEFLPCDWLIRCLSWREAEQVYLIKWQVSVIYLRHVRFFWQSCISKLCYQHIKNPVTCILLIPLCVHEQIICYFKHFTHF